MLFWALLEHSFKFSDILGIGVILLDSFDMILNNSVIVLRTQTCMFQTGQCIVYFAKCVGRDRVGVLASLVSAVLGKLLQQVIHYPNQMLNLFLGKDKGYDTILGNGHLTTGSDFCSQVGVHTSTCRKVQLVETGCHVGVVVFPQLVATAGIIARVLPHLMLVGATCAPARVGVYVLIMSQQTINLGPNVGKLFRGKLDIDFFHG